MKTLDRILENVKNHPDRIACQDSNCKLSYGVLWTMAGRLAQVLSAYPEKRVLLYGQKSCLQLAAMLGCLIAGKTYIPTTPEQPAQRLRRIYDAVRPCVVVSDEQPPMVVQSHLDISLLSDESIRPASPVESFAPAYIMFTSGSTGEPKGVPISRGNLDCFTNWITGLPELQLPSPSQVLNQASFSFDLSVADIYYSFCGGHTLCLPPSTITEDPQGLLDCFRLNRIHLLVCTPTFLKLCLLQPEFSATQLQELRVVYTCGEILDKRTAAKLLKLFPDLCLYNAYGPTEATSAICGVQITQKLLQQDDSLPVGTVAEASCKVEIIQDEIILTGRCVFSGYLSSVESEIRTFENDAAYHTGDRGEIKNGLLYYRGREDRQVKWSGYRIELDEIEACLNQLPGVRQCAVISRKNEQGIVNLIKAFVVLEPGVSVAEVRKALSGLLPAYMIPRAIIPVDSIPINTNGKIDRKELAEYG